MIMAKEMSADKRSPQKRRDKEEIKEESSATTAQRSQDGLKLDSPIKAK